MWMLPVVASGFVLSSGCVIEPGRVVFRPPVVVAPAPVVVAPAPPAPVVVAPAPVVVEPEVLVPDSYVWDGVEFVGVVGGAYVYLGPDNAWIRCDDVHLARFHDYERFHPDWRMHATVNVNFRRDRYGHEAPRREPGREPQRQREEKKDR